MLTTASLLLVSVTEAQAIPIVSLTVSPGRPITSSEAVVLRPRRAIGCRYKATTTLYQLPPGGTPVAVDSVGGTFRNCTRRRGRLYGATTTTIPTSVLPGGTYRICETASQRLRGGRTDRDTRCLDFTLP